MRSCSASDPVRIAQEERIGIPILGSRGYRIWFRFGTGPIPVNIYGTTDGGGRLTDSLDKHGFRRDALRHESDEATPVPTRVSRAKVEGCASKYGFK